MADGIADVGIGGTGSDVVVRTGNDGVAPVVAAALKDTGKGALCFTALSTMASIAIFCSPKAILGMDSKPKFKKFHECL